MPQGKEHFYADFSAIISYLAMCLWSLCLPVGCEGRLKFLCSSQPHQPALGSGGVQAWLKALQTGVWRFHASACLAGIVVFTWRSWTTEVLLSLLGHRSHSSFSRCLSDLRTPGLCEENGALCLLPLPGRELRQQHGQGAIPGLLSASTNQAIETCKALSSLLSLLPPTAIFRGMMISMRTLGGGWDRNKLLSH